ncbi:MAG: ABC transporter permease, partial [Mesorhizobium sp.]
MSTTAITPQPTPFGRRLKRFMADRPLIPLIILLVILVLVLQILRPG